MNKHRFFAMVAVLLLMCLLCAAAAGEGAHLGEAMYDFTVRTSDGGQFTLSQALAGSGAVLINIFKINCPPCRTEFPFLQGAKEKFGDRISIIALSMDEEDTLEELESFKVENGLTFSLGNDQDMKMFEYFACTGTPCSILVDRFGKICFMHESMLPSQKIVEDMFAAVLDPSYTQSKVFTTYPHPALDVNYPSDDRLTEAARAQGSSLVFTSDAERACYPFRPGTLGGVKAAFASNTEIQESTAAMYTQVEAPEDGLLIFEYFMATNKVGDSLKVKVDGRIRTVIVGGEPEWEMAAVPVEKGTHSVSIEFRREIMGKVTDQGLVCGIHNMDMVYGEQAAPIAEALLSYPRTDEFSISVVNDGAELYGIGDGTDYGALTWLVRDADTVYLEVTLASVQDPESCVVIAGKNFKGVRLSDCTMYTENGFVVGLPYTLDENYSCMTCFLYDAKNRAVTQALYICRDEQSMRGLAGVLECQDIRPISDVLQELQGTGVQVSVEDLNRVTNLDQLPGSSDEPNEDEVVLLARIQEASGNRAQQTEQAEQTQPAGTEGGTEADNSGSAQAGESAEQPETPVGGENASPDTSSAPSGISQGELLIVVQDQFGTPVPDVVCSLFTDNDFIPKRSDKQGQIRMDSNQQAYHLQILKVPKGYGFNQNFEIDTEAGGGIYYVTINRKS